MSEATALVGLKSLRLSFELVASGGDEQETDKDTVQFVFPLNNTDTIAATFALADEGTNLDFLLEHKGQPQSEEESFSRYGGHVTFRSSAIVGSCHREPFREDPDQGSNSTVVALDNRSASNHLYFIVDLLLKEHGSQEEGQELVSLFGNPASYPNNNDDNSYPASEDSDSAEYWSDEVNSENEEIMNRGEVVDVDPEKKKILDETQRLCDVPDVPEGQKSSTKSAKKGAKPAAKKTPKPNPNPETKPPKTKKDKKDQGDKDADKGGSSERGSGLGGGVTTVVQTVLLPMVDVSKILATTTKSALLEMTSKEEKQANEVTAMPPLLLELLSTSVSLKIASPSLESKLTVETGSALNVGSSQSDGEGSKALPEPSHEQQDRKSKRAHEKIEDEDEDESSFLSRDGHCAFKKKRQ